MKKIKRIPVTEPKEVPQYRSSTSGLPSEPKAPGFVDQLIDEFYKPADVFAELDEVKPVSPKASSSSSQAQRQPLPSVVEIGAACPACASYSSTVRTSRVDKKVFMKMPTGELHQGVRFSYRNCCACNQRYVVRSPL